MENNLRFFRILPGALAAAALLVAVSQAQAVTLQGNPFSPANSGVDIFAVQGIDVSHPLGQTGFSPQVNTDFEFTPSVGVSYDTGGGKLTNFGLGLYQDASKNTFSTGLNFQFNKDVSANSISILVEDFDIKLGATAFDLKNKVAPTITLLGPGNTIAASFGPADILPAMASKSDANGKFQDVWIINFSNLLAQKGLGDMDVVGFLLAADNANGEKANSDPYLFLSSGPVITILPEGNNYIFGLGAILIAILFQGRQLWLKRNAVKS